MILNIQKIIVFIIRDDNTLANLISCWLEEMYFEDCVFALGLLYTFIWVKAWILRHFPQTIMLYGPKLGGDFPLPSVLLHWSLFLFLPTVFKVRKKNAHHLICMNIQNQRIKNLFFKVPEWSTIFGNYIGYYNGRCKNIETHWSLITFHIYSHPFLAVCICLNS